MEQLKVEAVMRALKGSWVVLHVIEICLVMIVYLQMLYIRADFNVPVWSTLAPFFFYSLYRTLRIVYFLCAGYPGSGSKRAQSIINWTTVLLYLALIGLELEVIKREYTLVNAIFPIAVIAKFFACSESDSRKKVWDIVLVVCVALGILQSVCVTLKADGAIEWGWYLVLLPAYGLFGVCAVIGGFYSVIAIQKILKHCGGDHMLEQILVAAWLSYTFLGFAVAFAFLAFNIVRVLNNPEVCYLSGITISIIYFAFLSCQCFFVYRYLERTPLTRLPDPHPQACYFKEADVMEMIHAPNAFASVGLPPKAPKLLLVHSDVIFHKVQDKAALSGIDLEIKVDPEKSVNNVTNLSRNAIKGEQSLEEAKEGRAGSDMQRFYKEEEGRASAVGNANSCSLCIEEEANGVLQDCGHGGICFRCGVKLLYYGRQCHLCREAVKMVLKIDTSGKVEGGHVRVLSGIDLKGLAQYAKANIKVA